MFGRFGSAALALNATTNPSSESSSFIGKLWLSLATDLLRIDWHTATCPPVATLWFSLGCGFAFFQRNFSLPIARWAGVAEVIEDFRQFGMSRDCLGRQLLLRQR